MPDGGSLFLRANFFPSLSDLARFCSPHSFFFFWGSFLVFASVDFSLFEEGRINSVSLVCFSSEIPNFVGV